MFEGWATVLMVSGDLADAKFGFLGSFTRELAHLWFVVAIATEAAPPFAVFEGWAPRTHAQRAVCPRPPLHINPWTFPQINVTSDLAPSSEKVDHCQGGGGARDSRKKSTKSFVVKIVTSKPLGLKILQRLFANPAPVVPFPGVREGGTSVSVRFPEMKPTREALSEASRWIFFRSFRSLVSGAASCTRLRKAIPSNHAR